MSYYKSKNFKYRTRKFFFLFITFILFSLIALFLFSKMRMQQPNALVEGYDNPSYRTSTGTAVLSTDIPLTAEVHIITPTTDTAFDFSAALTQNVNGLVVQARNIRRGNGMIRADICYPLVDDGDWGIYDAYIRYDGHEEKYKRSILVEPLVLYKNGHPGQRCDTLEFNVLSTLKLSEFTISIRSFAATPREGLGCEQIAKVQNKLNVKSIGIHLTCKTENGIESYEIIGKPASMSQEEAQKLVYNELISLTEGPWEFTVQLK